MAAQIAANAPAARCCAPRRRRRPRSSPCPPHPRRRRARGFDPAELIARALARRTGLPLRRALRRGRAPSHQLGASRAARRDPANLHFGARGPAPRRVVLVDDVHTTGATLDACARGAARGGQRARRRHHVGADPGRTAPLIPTRPRRTIDPSHVRSTERTSTCRSRSRAATSPSTTSCASWWSASSARSPHRSPISPAWRSSCTRSATPSIADSQVAGVTLYLKGVTLHAECASREIEHSIRLCSDELARQVKRHREKRRRRREARGAQPHSRHVVGRLLTTVRTRRASPAASVSSSAMALLDRALRMGEAKQFKQFEKRVARINDFEPELELESMEELRARMDSCASRRATAQSLDDLLPETFALVREVGKREMGMRHFDVQMIGGMVLHAGSIAEMKTGEGKTLTATLAVVLNALPGSGVHVVTVNDYLARRDAEWMSPIYHALGLNVGVLQNMQPVDEKHGSYAADVTYGTNSEFGFDYLRDNMAQSLEEKVQRGHPFAIVDEVDNILIDEARTPLIISGQPEAAADYYEQVRPARQADGARQEARGHGPAAEEGVRRRLRLRVRGEAQDRLGDRARRREGREVPRHRAPLPRRERPARQPPAAGAEGRVALQARRRLRRRRRPGHDHRRVHRPHPRGPALVGGPAPGDRGQGGRARPGGEPDPRDDHAAELLPPLRQARGHDRHGAHRGHRVHEDLQAAGRRDPDEPGDDPQGPERPGLQDARRQVGRRQPRDHRRATRPASRCSSAPCPSRSPSCCRASSTSTASSTRCSTPSPSTPSARRRSSPRPASRAPSRSRRTWPAAASTSSSAATPSTSPSASSRGWACSRATPTTRRASTTSCRRSRSASRPTRRRSSPPAGCTSSAPSATSRGASTTSCAAAPAARAIPASRASSSPPRTTSCACSPATGSTRSSTASARPTRRAARSRSRPACSPSRSRRPRRRSRSRTSCSASACSSTTTS